MAWQPPAIPDVHLMPPTVGRVGFIGPAWAPPQAWLLEHTLAETGGFMRQGRRWQRASEDYIPFTNPCAPVRTLYNPLIARLKAEGAALQGWCVDA